MDPNAWNIEILLQQVEDAYKKEHIEPFWHAERGNVKAALEAIAKKLPAKRYSAKGVLGVGGSGIVLRIGDQLFPQSDNALKFPRPVPGKISLVADMLAKEMGQLAELRHPGIVRILYYAKVADVKGYGELPFYLMEAVSGIKSERFVKTSATDETSFLSLVHGMAKIIRYMHTHPSGGFAHLDIKPDNVVVDTSAAPRPIMIDLGTCKQVRGDETFTVVACTRSFAHPELVRRLATDPTDENRAKGDLHRSEIDPAWDLWSFGQTILSWLGLDFHLGAVEEHSIFPRLTAYTRKYLLLLCARLLSAAPQEWLQKRIGLSADFLRQFAIKSASELCELLERMDGTVGPIMEIEELRSSSTGTMQAASGQHVHNTARFQSVIEHRLFRRLNAITQLGFVSQVFPGATHSRRNHSLGTYANTATIIRALWNDSISPLFRQLITNQDCHDLLLAALLHDLGQFPLAHDFEEIDDTLFNHGDLTQAMLRGKWDKKKKGSVLISFESLAEVFVKWGTTAERIIEILTAKPNSAATAKSKLLRSIISGPIDADKLDYLLRDARHTNLPYPKGIDVDRLLGCLTTIVVDRIEGGARDVPALGVHSKGKVAAEFVSFARYAMFSQAYWHHTVRAQKAMLYRAVRALIAKHDEDQKAMEFQSEFIAMVTGLPEILFSKRAGELFAEQIVAKRDDEFKGFDMGTDLEETDAAVLV